MNCQGMNIAIVAGTLGIAGTAVGAILNGYLSRKMQRAQWAADCRKVEYQELLTVLCKEAGLIMENLTKASGGSPDDKEAFLRAHYEGRRILQDRLFIAEKLEKHHIPKLWLDAVRSCVDTHDPAKFQRLFEDVKAELIALATKDLT